LTDRRFTPAEAAALTHGPDEESLVNSGLEETMVSAYHELRETRNRLGSAVDLRTAAFVDAIDKIARSYLEMGIWP
ncbi:MAG: Glu/Leu/Phe/Val dehydrogenase, partial [Deltaproteobacteria bacterium]|nr:Glu/Leu/Phe/Val dehydrogenase [Deltaproteobacteria bacterium]